MSAVSLVRRIALPGFVLLAGPLFPCARHHMNLRLLDPCRPDFHRAGGRETVCAHQRHADGTDEAGRVLVEAGSFPPSGPLIVLVSVPKQVMQVYRKASSSGARP